MKKTYTQRFGHKSDDELEIRNFFKSKRAAGCSKDTLNSNKYSNNSQKLKVKIEQTEKQLLRLMDSDSDLRS
jgi:hypothetical protein